jgi:hypothetical protein
MSGRNLEYLLRECRNICRKAWIGVQIKFDELGLHLLSRFEVLLSVNTSIMTPCNIVESY